MSDTSDLMTDDETFRPQKTPPRRSTPPVPSPRKSVNRLGTPYGIETKDKQPTPIKMTGHQDMRDEPTDLDERPIGEDEPEDDLVQHVPPKHWAELSRRTGCHVDDLREATRDLDKIIPVDPTEDRETRAGRIVQRALEMAKSAAEKINPFRLWDEWQGTQGEDEREVPPPVEHREPLVSRRILQARRNPSPANKSKILGFGRAAADRSARFRDPPVDSIRSHGSHVPPPEHNIRDFTPAEQSNAAALSHIMNMLHEMSKANERRDRDNEKRDKVTAELAKSIGAKDKELRERLEQQSRQMRDLSDDLADVIASLKANSTAYQSPAGRQRLVCLSGYVGASEETARAGTRSRRPVFNPCAEHHAAGCLCSNDRLSRGR